MILMWIISRIGGTRGILNLVIFDIMYVFVKDNKQFVMFDQVVKRQTVELRFNDKIR